METERGYNGYKKGVCLDDLKKPISKENRYIFTTLTHLCSHNEQPDDVLLEDIQKFTNGGYSNIDVLIDSCSSLASYQKTHSKSILYLTKLLAEALWHVDTHNETLEKCVTTMLFSICCHSQLNDDAFYALVKELVTMGAKTFHTSYTYHYYALGSACAYQRNHLKSLSYLFDIFIKENHSKEVKIPILSKCLWRIVAFSKMGEVDLFALVPKFVDAGAEIVYTDKPIYNSIYDICRHQEKTFDSVKYFKTKDFDIKYIVDAIGQLSNTSTLEDEKLLELLKYIMEKCDRFSAYKKMCLIALQALCIRNVTKVKTIIYMMEKYTIDDSSKYVMTECLYWFCNNYKFQDAPFLHICSLMVKFGAHASYRNEHSEYIHDTVAICKKHNFFTCRRIIESGNTEVLIMKKIEK